MDNETLLIQLNTIEEEVYKIFDMVIDSKEISGYKSHLLRVKLDILRYQIDIIKDDLNNYDETLVKKYNNTKKIAMLFLIIGIILTVISPLISIGPMALFWFLRNRLLNMSKEIEDSYYITNRFFEEINSLEITFENCYNFINLRTNHEIDVKDEDLSEEELNKIYLADQTIEITIADDECDLNKLLEMVYEEESKKDNGEMVRKREKK